METIITGKAQDIVIMVFGAGLITGFTVYFLANGISSALRIIKNF